jgi:hypothetical protein
LVEGDAFEEVGMTDIGGNRGLELVRVEVSVDLTGVFVQEKYLLGLVFEKGKRVDIESSHLFLLNIFSSINCHPKYTEKQRY